MKSVLDVYMKDYREADVVGEFTIPMRIFPMEQGSFPKAKSREFKKVIRKMCAEEEVFKYVKKGEYCGVRFVFKGKRRGDQSNCIKLLEDALELVAYDNDKQIDYHEVHRRDFEHEGLILVEILQVVM